MSRSNIYGQDVFFQKMKKKPALQTILDNLEHFSEEQLEQVDQPLWIRQQLIKLKQRGGVHAEDMALQLANAMMAAMPAPQAEPAREVREWRREPTFVGGGASGDFAFEVDTGDIILLLPPHTDVTVKQGHTMRATHYEAKVGATVIKLTPAQWSVLLQGSALVGMMTPSQYGQAVQQRLAAKYG